MFPGETIATGANDRCCGRKLTTRVLQSGAGYYIGTRCPRCGSPVTRESGYYPTIQAATHALETGDFGRPIGYHGS
jgi:hypothetical protein